MTKYSRGDVILVPFPYTDQTGSKRRPAVVISSLEFNDRRHDLICAPITSNLKTGQIDDVVLTDSLSAGLFRPSVVKGIINAIEQKLILRCMGRLSETDMQLVHNRLGIVLGFVVAEKL